MVENKTPGGQGDSALTRWSRRKQQVRAGQEQAVQDSAEAAATQQDPDAGAEMAGVTPDVPATEPPATEPVADSEEPLLTDADMPPLESLDSNSDLSCFFNSGVSEKLRQAALRRLLRLPAFNIRDGLNDYDEDYTVFEPLGDIVTSDMRFHAERKARLAEEEEAARLAQRDEDADQAFAEDAAPDETVEIDGQTGGETGGETGAETEPDTDQEMRGTESDAQFAQSRGNGSAAGNKAGSTDTIDPPAAESPPGKRVENQAAGSNGSSNQSNRKKQL